MASPFRIFRKHQKALLAVLAILAMGAFVFLDPIIGALGGGGSGSGRSNPVVVRWNGGELRELDISRMVLLRSAVNDFVAIAARLGAEGSGREPEPFAGFGPLTERDVVQTWLFAKAAEEKGFVVSDKAINRFLERITQNSVPPARLRAILGKRYAGDRLINMEMIFEGLRTELLAQQLVAHSMIAADSVTPLERWTTWRRLNERVTVDLVGFPTERFLDQVPDPSDGEIEVFYAEHKDRVREPVLESGAILYPPTPAFKQPRRVALEYVRADYDAFVDALMPTITDEEIAAYYEQNKRSFVRPDLMEDSGDTPADETTKPAETPAQPQTQEPPKTPPTETETPQSEAPQPETPATPATEAPAPETPAPAPETPAPETPAGSDSPAEPPPTEPPVDAGGASRPNRSGRHSIRLVSAPAQASAAEPTSTADGAGAANSSEPAAANNAADAAAEAKTPPQTTSGPADGTGAAAAEASNNPTEPRYAPLDEVRDEIRRELARQKAPVKAEATLKPLLELLARYYERLQVWQVSQEEAEADQPLEPRPQPPDAAAWAAEHGVVFERTSPLPFFELGNTALGQSIVVSASQSLLEQAFQALEVYQPVDCQDFQGNRYVAWKVQDQPETVPALGEIRDEVVRAWKLVKARELVRQEAEKLAEQARSQPLADVVAGKEGYQVIRSDPFSWFTAGPVPSGRDARLRISEVLGVDGAGPEFMEAVFGLNNDGDVTVAMNYPQTAAYIVKLASREESLDAMRDRFLRESGPLDGLVRQQNRLIWATAALRELQQSLGIEGLEKLDTRRGETTEAGA